jgi:hypothetical protein
VTSQLLHRCNRKRAVLGFFPIGRFIYEWKSPSLLQPCTQISPNNCIRLQTDTRNERIWMGKGGGAGLLVYYQPSKRFPFLRFLFLYSSWEPSHALSSLPVLFIYHVRARREEKRKT